MSDKLILYTTNGCDVCDRARAELAAERTDFEERNVMHDKAWFDEVLRHTIFVPMVVQGDRVEIGWRGAVG
jgi:glutaredoxin